MVTELPESSSDEATRSKLRELYKIAVPADAIARAVAYAIEQPNEVEINEIAIRPTAQELPRRRQDEGCRSYFHEGVWRAKAAAVRARRIG